MSTDPGRAVAAGVSQIAPAKLNVGVIAEVRGEGG